MANGPTIPSSNLDDLRLGLAQADLLSESASTPEEERIAMLVALKSIYDCLKSAGLRSKALNNFSMALQDIARGIALALFSPRINNRPRDRAKVFNLKASSAAAMQLCMDSGKSKSEAAAAVARQLSTAGFQTRPATVARWRDKFSGHSDEEGADTYQFVLQEARAANTAPAKQAKLVMRGIMRLVGNLDKPPS